MLDLMSGASVPLIATGSVLLAVLAIIWKAFRVGRQVERGRADAGKIKGWIDANKLQDRAQNARRNARRGADAELLSDDGFKRPKS